MRRRTLQVPFTFRLAARFARSRTLRRSTSIVFLTGLFLVAMHLLLSALTLSGDQRAERDLGRFGAQIGFGTVSLDPGDASFAQDLTRRMRALGHDGAEVMLTAHDVRLGGTPARDATLVQGAWRDKPYADRYVLLSGRWPEHPGEVAVTEPDDFQTAPGRKLPAMGGKVVLQVVGTVEDRYAKTSNLLAAPGTWESWTADLFDDFQGFRAQPYLLWSGEDLEEVAAAFDAEVGERRLPDEGAQPAADTVILRQEVTAQTVKTWIERSPAGYTVPSILLPVGAVLLVFGLNDRRFRREIAVLASLGVSRSKTAVSLALAALFWCSIAATAGGLAGTVTGLAARPLLTRLHEQPLGPVTGLGEVALRLGAALLLAAICAGATLAARPADGGRRRASTQEKPPKPRSLGRDARQVAAALAVAGAIFYTPRVTSPADAMIYSGIITAAVLLAIPEILRLAFAVLPERGPRTRLARRRLLADHRRASASVAVLTVLTGASLGYLALLDTVVSTLDGQRHPDVLSGQLLVTDRSTQVTNPPAKVLEFVEATAPRQSEGFPLGFLQTAASLDTSRSVNREGSFGSILAVDSAQQIEGLIGRELSAAQRATIQDGGLLVWADALDAPDDATGQASLLIKEGDTTVGRTPPLPTAPVTVPPSGWRAGTDGVMLASRSAELGLPLTRGAVLYTGLTQKQTENIQIHVPPPPVIPHAGFLTTAAGLVLLILLAILATTRSQTRTLRGYLGQLLALGLPVAWARHVLLYQHLVIIGLSVTLGAFIGAVPISAVVLQDTDFVLSIPEGQLLLLAAAIFLAGALGTTWSIRRLTARDSAEALSEISPAKSF